MKDYLDEFQSSKDIILEFGVTKCIQAKLTRKKKRFNVGNPWYGGE